jgi:negative regulator of sigma-B (phosphoserine phosphatase)
VTTSAGCTPTLEWAWADAPLMAEGSGDRAVVAPFPDGVLLAVIDGLGHGREAADAADAAVQVLETDPAGPILELVAQCHEAMRKTRGAAMSLVSIRPSDSTLSWVGIGNVDAVVLRAQKGSRTRLEALLPRGGIVGYRLPALRRDFLTLEHGDTLCLATDGVSSGFTTGLRLAGSASDLASSLLATFGTGTDDALVLVARYYGGAA